MTKLSDRVRAGSEAAPWVIEEIKRLEQQLVPVERSGCTAGNDEECTHRGCATGGCPAAAQQAPEQKPPRTDQEIVDQTEALAVWLLSWAFNHQPETSTPMRESNHPFAKRCWFAACHIQERLTATDPENAVAELEGFDGRGLDESDEVGALADEQARDQQEAPFEEWWEREGQFCRAGGGQYEKTFAWRAWIAAHGIIHPKN